jgi:RNA polymerase-binding transcription factor DksA
VTLGIALAPDHRTNTRAGLGTDLYCEVLKMMDGMLLQTVEGLGEPLVPTGCEIWEWLQSEKEEVACEILSEGPLCQNQVNGMQESEASEEYGREVEWRFRGYLEARLRELNEAQDRLMDGAYGRCKDCDAEIDRRRIAADPAAALCIACQLSAGAEVVICTL